MTIKECIDIVDNVKPNQYGIKEKVMWLSFVDETIINDVLKTHEGYDGRYDLFEGYTEDKLSQELIVPSPYDRLYPQYIKMMIDSENGETARYNNSAALYNTYLNEYKKYYNKTHMPLNATQKIPSPVSININSHLSDAQIEYIKRQLYYMLSQDVGEVISHDKLYDIAMEYYQNNTEVLKGKDGEKGDKGEDGTKYYGFPEVSLEVGSETVITFDFDEDGIDGNTGLSKQDYPGIDEWRMGDMLISANGRVLLIVDIIRSGVKVKWLTVRCVSDLKGDKGDIGSAIYAVNMGLPKDCKVGTDYAVELGEFICPEGIKDGDYMIDGDSSCMFLFTDLKGTDASLGGNTSRVVCVANLNGEVPEGVYASIGLDNVSNEDFKRKAEEAGVGGDNAELLGDAPMVFKGVVDALPPSANEGEVYKLVTTDYKWSTHKSVINDNSALVLNEYGLDCNDSGGDSCAVWDEVYNWVQNDNSYKPFLIKLCANGRQYIYKATACDSGEIPEEAGYPYTQYWAVTCDEPISMGTYQTLTIGDTVEIYLAPADSEPIATKELYVYHNGEWVEL